MECVLCRGKFPSKVKLVQHFRETHSIAKQRPRRVKAAEGIRRITIDVDDFDSCVEQRDEEVKETTNTQQLLSCRECGNHFATQADFENHTCSHQKSVQQLKQFVSCVYCGQKCKNSRGATIHQVFCEQRMNGSSLKVIHYECPADDCGAIFKGQSQLIKHVKNHHAEDGIAVIRSLTPPPVNCDKANFLNSIVPSVPQQVSESPMVTVTMKPHVGKTDGLQDLSLLITPTKGMDDTSEFQMTEKTDRVESNNKEARRESASITVEECLSLDAGLKSGGQAVLCVAEDGSVSQASENQNTDITDNEKTFLLITDNNLRNNKCIKFYDCKLCDELFLENDALSYHVAKTHAPESHQSSVRIKEEPRDDSFHGSKKNDDDMDWEFVSFRSEKKDQDVRITKGKFEYVCKLCHRSFLCELSYHGHIRNEDCRTKKFKLPRLFSCHFLQCDSSFFKLTELQKHWLIAHKYTVASETHEFEDEKAFMCWVGEEEEKHKVRFTCDVRRRKPHRTERLMVCHRFHTLRTAAARKAAKREYSDKHNWIHKIEPCLCFARMKVYQDFDKDTCDYTGKIHVVYYFEHSHPTAETSKEKEEILEHVLQRNKRNRDILFQELKGNEKVQHRQKLEKFARLAGKEYRTSTRNIRTSNTRKLKRDIDDGSVLSVDQVNSVHVSNNILESDGFFDSPVEMVLDGQFDMSHDVLSGPVVTHLDTLAIFDGTKIKPDNCCANENGEQVNQEDGDLQGEDSSIVLPASPEDWGKLFQFARSRIENNDDAALKAEAALVLPYEKVIGLITPSEQIPIFQQLWELAYPAFNSEEVIQVVKLDVVR